MRLVLSVLALTVAAGCADPISLDSVDLDDVSDDSAEGGLQQLPAEAMQCRSDSGIPERIIVKRWADAVTLEQGGLADWWVQVEIIDLTARIGENIRLSVSRGQAGPNQPIEAFLGERFSIQHVHSIDVPDEPETTRMTYSYEMVAPRSCGTLVGDYEGDPQLLRCAPRVDIETVCRDGACEIVKFGVNIRAAGDEDDHPNPYRSNPIYLYVDATTPEFGRFPGRQRDLYQHTMRWNNRGGDQPVSEVVSAPDRGVINACGLPVIFGDVPLCGDGSGEPCRRSGAYATIEFDGGWAVP